jgi:hypothetical protein
MKKNQTRALQITLSILIIGMIVPALTVHAAEDGNDKNKKATLDPVIIIAPTAPSTQSAPNQSTSTPATDNSGNANTSTQTSTTNTTPASTSTTASSAQASSTPVSSETTTSPTDTTVPPKSAPQNGDPINQDVENILNQIIAPQTIKQPVTPTETPKKPVKTTTTKKLTPTASTTINSTSTSTTTEAIGSLSGPSTDGSSNQFSPNNYYFPLDRLSPQTTYILSTIALILGITGSVLIIRSKSATEEAVEEEEVWAPIGPHRAPLRTQNPLLEP